MMPSWKCQKMSQVCGKLRSEVGTTLESSSHVSHTRASYVGRDCVHTGCGVAADAEVDVTSRLSRAAEWSRVFTECVTLSCLTSPHSVWLGPHWTRVASHGAARET